MANASRDIITSYFLELLSEPRDNTSIDLLSADKKKNVHSTLRKSSDISANTPLAGDPAKPVGHAAPRQHPIQSSEYPGSTTLAEEDEAMVKPSKTAHLDKMHEESSALLTLEEEKKKQLQSLLVPPTPTVVIPEHHVPVEALSVDTDELRAETECPLDLSGVPQTSHEKIERLSIEWHANGRPYWAQDDFDALLFEVSGLTLAVPLASLGQIVVMDDKLTSIFGQSEWFIGIQPSPIGDLNLINTALFVMPEKYNDDFLRHATYAISLHGVQWALAVEQVSQPVRLSPSDVVWRSERSARPWLAGTVKSHMCALIDVPKMSDILDKSSSKRAKP